MVSVSAGILKRRGRFPRGSARNGNALLVAIAIPTLIVLFLALQAWWWIFCRIEIESNEVGILIAKTGENLPPGAIIATSPDQKGIQREVLSEGRYFYNPFFWDWEIVKMVEVPPGQVGVLIRQYGDDIPDAAIRAGQILASGTQKGITERILVPGKYRINPYAEEVQLHKAVEIPAGYVGVVTNLTGRIPRTPNTFLVEEGEKGVLHKILTPGIYFLHPFMTKVNLMDCRSQRFELSGNEAVVFPSNDAFQMTVLMTLEWAIDQKRAPEIFVRIGEMDSDPDKNEILQKVITPAIRGFGRIEGSKYSAIEYIAGISRQVFQNTLFEKMKANCEPKGILIKSVLINDIEPPQDIAKPIREREIAKEELNRNKNQLLQAQAEQNLARSEELVKQESEKVNAKTANLVRIIEAQNTQKISLIDQDKRLTMEKSFLEASRLEAQAILARGKAEADVIRLTAEAEAEAFRKAVEAFRNPDLFAYHEFLTRLAPAFSTILANTDGFFGRIFQGMAPSTEDRKGGAQ